MIIKYPTKIFGLGLATEKKIDQLLNQLHESVDLGLHLGSGSIKIPNLINCDLYDENADEKIDCLNLEKYKKDSVDLIETHHMVEHLTFEELDKALIEWNRVLKPGGFLILTVPNITWVSIKWIWLTLLSKFVNVNKTRDYVLKMFYGPQSYEGMIHKSGFDASILKKILLEQNFKVEFTHTPYPNRPTPSLLVIAKKQ